VQTCCMTKLLVGGCGYIGAHIFHSLIDANPPLVALDDLSSGYEARLPADTSLYNFSLQNLDGLKRSFELSNVTHVIHLAAKKRVGESVERPDYYWQENVVGFENLLSVMAEFEVKNLLFSSSAAVYGQPDLKVGSLIAETDSCNPINPYGETKLAGEQLAQEYATKHGASVIALRYFNVAGAGRKDLGDRFTYNLIPIVFDALDRGERPVVFGNDYETSDGTCIRDYVHAQDLADAHIAALDLIDRTGFGFDAINIGTGVGASVLEVIDTISEVTGKSIRPKIVDRRIGDPASLVADVCKAKEVLNWESKRSLKEIVSSAWVAWRFDRDK
jgi:UDP-glucose 4-epimerase